MSGSKFFAEKLLTVNSESVPFTPDLKRLKKLVEIGDERTLKNYLKYLEDGGTIIALPKRGSGLKGMGKPEKIYLNNTNQIYAISGRGKENIGNMRETFFVGMLGGGHQISVPKRGDFFVDGSYTFEIGGRNKGFEQIKGIPDSYLAIDDIESGIGKKCLFKRKTLLEKQIGRKNDVEVSEKRSARENKYNLSFAGGLILQFIFSHTSYQCSGFRIKQFAFLISILCVNR